MPSVIAFGSAFDAASIAAPTALAAASFPEDF